MYALMAIVMLLLTPAAARAAELVMFEEAGCVWCLRWHAEIGPGYPHSEEGRAAPLRRLDLRAPLPSDFKLARPVVSTPTFVLVENGEEKDRLVGYPGAEFFYPLLARMIARLKSRGEREAIGNPADNQMRLRRSAGPAAATSPQAPAGG